MKNEEKKKKGFFGMLRESFSKSGGCCGGTGCCGPAEQSENERTSKAGKDKATSKPAQP